MTRRRLALFPIRFTLGTLELPIGCKFVPLESAASVSRFLPFFEFREARATILRFLNWKGLLGIGEFLFVKVWYLLCTDPRFEITHLFGFPCVSHNEPCAAVVYGKLTHVNPKNFFAKQGFVKDTINTLNERVYIL